MLDCSRLYRCTRSVTQCICPPPQRHYKDPYGLSPFTLQLTLRSFNCLSSFTSFSVCVGVCSQVQMKGSEAGDPPSWCTALTAEKPRDRSITAAELLISTRSSKPHPEQMLEIFKACHSNFNYALDNWQWHVVPAGYSLNHISQFPVRRCATCTYCFSKHVSVICWISESLSGRNQRRNRLL